MWIVNIFYGAKILLNQSIVSPYYSEIERKQIVLANFQKA